MDPPASVAGGANVGMTTRGSVGLSPVQAASAASMAAPMDQARRLIMAVRIAGFLSVERGRGGGPSDVASPPAPVLRTRLGTPAIARPAAVELASVRHRSATVG